MSDQEFQRLVEAIRAYARGLALHGAMGERWAEDAPDLDALWAEILEAAGLTDEFDQGAH